MTIDIFNQCKEQNNLLVYKLFHIDILHLQI